MSDEKQSNMGRIMRDKGSRKLLAFAGVAIVFAVGYSVFGGKGAPGDSSVVRNVPPVDATQGKAPVTPVYQENLQKDDQSRVAQAKQQGLNAGAMPTVVAASTGSQLPSTLDSANEKPRDKAPERPQPEPEKKVEAPVRPTMAEKPVAPPPQQQQQVPRGPVVDQNLMGAMQRQMQDIMKARTGFPPASTQWFYDARAASLGAAPGTVPATGYGQPTTVGYGQVPGASYGQPTSNGYGQAPVYGAAPTAGAMPGYGASPVYPGAVGYGAQPGYGAAVPGAVAQASRFRSPAAGTILYSRLIGRINSDVPGPVVAEILQGPFTGARLLGSFQATEQGAIVSFSSMTVPFTENGETKTEVVTIKAVAVDTAHLGTALATDIDRHMLEKIGIGFATSFLSGLGQAFSSSGASTMTYATGSTITNNPLLSTKDKLIVAGGKAADKTGEIFQQEYGNRKTTITVEADTPFGLLFLGQMN